jgi:MFS family permease
MNIAGASINSEPSYLSNSSSGGPTLRKSLEWITLEGTFGMVFAVLTGGAFLTGLALLMGANDFEIGLLGAIPFLAQVAQLASAYMVDLSGKRKAITLRSLVIARQTWWLLLPLPLIDNKWGLGILLAIVIISNIAAMMGTAAWMSWVADLVPDRIRGRYFGFRSGIIAISTITATLVGGAVLDYFKGIDHAGWGFSIIIGLGCAFGLIAIMQMNKLPDRPLEQTRSKILWTYIQEPLKNKNFRHLIKIFLVWNFACGIAAAFFSAHMISILKMSFTQISIYASASSIAAVLLNRPWGALVDRFGSKPIIVFCAFGIAFVPLLWWIPRPGHLWILAFEAVYSGALWTGFNLAAFNIPIANSPKQSRTAYLAVFSVITGLAFFIASILGGTLAQNWKEIHWQLGPQTVINYHLLFAISSLLRMLAALMVLRFHEPTEKDLPTMIQYMGDSFIKRLSTARQFIPWISKRVGELSLIPYKVGRIVFSLFAVIF